MDKIPCTGCGTLILPRTSEKNNGLCIPCSRGHVTVCVKCGGRAVKTIITESAPELCYNCFKKSKAEKPQLGLDDIAKIQDPKKGCEELDTWIWNNSLEDDQFNENPQAIKEYIALWWMDGEVYNGGFNQFLSNYTGRHVPDALSALNRICAFEIESILKEVIALLGADTYPIDDALRNDILDTFNEKSNEKLGKLSREFCQKSEAMWALLFKYFKKHKEEYLIKE